jgi:hypothetical protein
MTSYAVNDRQLIALWRDGSTLRWDAVTSVNGVAGAKALAVGLDEVSGALWRRCEFLGEQERLSAVVKSSLRRNGSSNPNRRRQKVYPAPWDTVTQRRLVERLRVVGEALELMPDNVRSNVRNEVLRELEAVLTWSYGGTDRDGRASQTPMPTTRRLQIAELQRSLTVYAQRGECDQPLNDPTQAVLALMLASAAVALAHESPGQGNSPLSEFIGRYARAESNSNTSRAIELVHAGNDPAAVVRAAVGDLEARDASLAEHVLYELFEVPTPMQDGSPDYRMFGENALNMFDDISRNLVVNERSPRRRGVQEIEPGDLRARTSLVAKRAITYSGRLGHDDRI